MEKLCRKCASEASPRPFFILLSNPNKPLHARHSLKNAKTKLENKDKVI